VDLPILKIRRSQGDDALLFHKRTKDEQTLFKEMDAAAVKLPKKSDLSEYHRVVAEIGSKYGLKPKQSIAFWTRTTLMIFEA
jgi:hypothetical protein